MLPTDPESETARDGVLSSRKEIHAIVLGLEAGLRGEVADDLVEQPESQDERHYFSGGFVLGWLLAELAQFTDEGL